MVANIVGGLGLFLLGMWILSEGLRLAAGHAMTHLLETATKTRLRGLGLGFGLTALIQHSGAVTVATIGFANAGILSLERAIWIIFGTNVGTTVTAWIVAFVGFGLNIKALALPMIGLGMALRLSRAHHTIGHLGFALAGFGLLFMGIDVLKSGFMEMGVDLHFAQLSVHPVLQLLLLTGIGVIFTVVVQSSSLTIAVTLSALAAGLVDVPSAAAIVIGSNIGSTSTSIFSVLSSHAVAKRLVAAHVCFNLMTASVSLIILWPLIIGIQSLQVLMFGAVNPTTTVALFHTVFNLLGVMLVWPISKQLLHFLNHRFVAEVDWSKPQFLDAYSATVPGLAFRVVQKECAAISQVLLSIVKDLVVLPHPQPQQNVPLLQLQTRLHHTAEFIRNLYPQSLPDTVAAQLPTLLRVLQYYSALVRLAMEFDAQKTRFETPVDPDIEQALSTFQELVRDCLSEATLEALDATQAAPDTPLYSKFESHYQSLKSLLLRRGAEGKLSVARMERCLSGISLLRRITQQAHKASAHFHPSIDSIVHAWDVDED